MIENRWFPSCKFFLCLLKCAEKAAVMVPSQATVMEQNGLLNGKKSITTQKGKMTSRKVAKANNTYKGNKYRVGEFLWRFLVPAKGVIIVRVKIGPERVKTLMPMLRME